MLHTLQFSLFFATRCIFFRSFSQSFASFLFSLVLHFTQVGSNNKMKTNLNDEAISEQEIEAKLEELQDWIDAQPDMPKNFGEN